jgi:hypothetical protein
MPLKGALLCAGYYPDSGIRALGDQDILIRQADLFKARQVLERLDYQFLKRSNKDETYIRGQRKSMVWAADNVHPVELQHRAVYEFGGRILNLTEDLWAWSSTGPYLDGVLCSMPDRAGAFSHVCAHASADWLLGQGKIAQILDLQVCTAKMMAEDWQILRKRLKPQQARFLYPAAAVACRCAQLDIPDEFLNWLRMESPEALQAWADQTPLAQIFGLHSDEHIRRDYSAEAGRLFYSGLSEQAETWLRMLFPPRWHSRLDAYPRLMASPLWPLAWLPLNWKRAKKSLHYE